MGLEGTAEKPGQCSAQGRWPLEWPLRKGNKMVSLLLTALWQFLRFVFVVAFGLLTWHPFREIRTEPGSYVSALIKPRGNAFPGVAGSTRLRVVVCAFLAVTRLGMRTARRRFPAGAQPTSRHFCVAPSMVRRFCLRGGKKQTAPRPPAREQSDYNPVWFSRVRAELSRATQSEMERATWESAQTRNSDS